MSTVSVASPVHQGMGAIIHDHGVAFRVWAPHADAVSVIGSFNNWSGTADPLSREENGHWYADVSSARPGDEYKFLIRAGDKEMQKIDPYARLVTNSVGSSVIYRSEFDWQGDDFQCPPHNELVIYEMHVGTFHRSDDDTPGRFRDTLRRLPHLKKLGVNALEIMPIAEFAGDVSWGYNPAHIFAIEGAYGGPEGFKRFVREAHAAGFAVIMDVVYNHLGPSDLQLWQFDGWSENDKGGIYFYNDERSQTPWGDTRPDYGRGEVRQFLHDNAMMWFREYHVDGLRYDMTLYIRSIDGSQELPDGWNLTQWINRDIHEQFPNAITIAEDLQNNAYLTKPQSEGGAGFSTQWDAGFVHPIRKALAAADDAHRSMSAVRDALYHNYNGNAFQRVVYTESHDEVANGKSRVPDEVGNDNEDLFAQKRSTLGAGLVLTAPGIPMLFQGQEFLQGGWFKDTEELDWDNRDQFSGILHLYADLIRLRRNTQGFTKGLTGSQIDVCHVNDADKVIAFIRRHSGGPADDVVVVANFRNTVFENYRIGLPAPGIWRLRFNSDWKGYSEDFHGILGLDCTAEDQPQDGQPCSGTLAIAPYSLLIFSQDPRTQDQPTQESEKKSSPKKAAARKSRRRRS